MFYRGQGVQHIALLSDDIVRTVKALRTNGIEFLRMPDTYYDMLILLLKKPTTSRVCISIIYLKSKQSEPRTALPCCPSTPVLPKKYEIHLEKSLIFK